MDDHLRTLAWHGVLDSNPWWTGAAFPRARAAPMRRHAFPVVYDQLRATEPGRGVVLLGPRRVGKSVFLHQVAEQLLADGVEPRRVCLLSLDDVALRECDFGELIALVEARQPVAGGFRYLLLDEIQHAPRWSGWLKRIADRRDPYVFLATGSSATALARGGQDEGVGRWREMMLFPWSFREHVELRGAGDLALIDPGAGADLRARALAITPAQATLLAGALDDYLLRGGFPEAALAEDLREARRRLKQDILDRALGRDITDVVDVDARVLERMFLRICRQPGGLWNASEVASDLGVSRALVSRYLLVLEGAFLVFRLPNLASPIKGLPKVYLVSPAMRAALLGIEPAQLRVPEEWGRMVENAVMATLVGARPNATTVGFWRQGDTECDGVVIEPSEPSELIEVKRGGRGAGTGITRAREALRIAGGAWVLTAEDPTRALPDGTMHVTAAVWLYLQSAAAGGTLRLHRR